MGETPVELTSTLTMNPGHLTIEQVIWIKRKLIGGATISMLCRMTGKSANTIQRIRSGQTHSDVVVEGEETLRPPIAVITREDAAMVTNRNVEVLPEWEPTPGETARSLETTLKTLGLDKNLRPVEGAEAQEPKARIGAVSPEMAEAAKQLGIDLPVKE